MDRQGDARAVHFVLRGPVCGATLLGSAANATSGASVLEPESIADTTYQLSFLVTGINLAVR